MMRCTCSACIRSAPRSFTATSPLRRISTLVILLTLAVATSGCVRAALYSRTVQPLTTDFRATPVAPDRSESDIKTVTFYVDVEWGDNGIGEIARQKGIAEIYYADVETITVLGYWKQHYVRVYGRPMAEAAAGP